MERSPIPQLEYIDAQARDICNNWAAAYATDGADLYNIASEHDLQNASEFWETFQDNIEAAAAGAPPIFPDPMLDTTNAAMLRMIHDLIAARVYQLLFCYELTEE